MHDPEYPTESFVDLQLITQHYVQCIRSSQALIHPLLIANQRAAGKKSNYSPEGITVLITDLPEADKKGMVVKWIHLTYDELLLSCHCHSVLPGCSL